MSQPNLAEEISRQENPTGRAAAVAAADKLFDVATRHFACCAAWNADGTAPGDEIRRLTRIGAGTPDSLVTNALYQVLAAILIEDGCPEVDADSMAREVYETALASGEGIESCIQHRLANR